MTEGDRKGRFAPVVLAGLGSSAVLAAVSARDWFVVDGGGDGQALVPEETLRADMPLALALALVVLAAWGVVLVTGSHTRRLMLALAGLATLGISACLVRAPLSLPDQIRDGLGDDQGRTAEPTAAYLIACVGVLLVLAAVALGWRLAPYWPTMSSRYDNPVGARAAQTDPSDPTDLWKAMDAGADPTDRGH